MRSGTLGAPASTVAPRSFARRIVAAAAVTLGVAACVFWLAYNDGTYGVSARSQLAIVVWWTIGLLATARWISLRRWSRASRVTGGLLALFALWTLASTAWTPSPGAAYTEFTRVLLYLGVFILATAATVKLSRNRIIVGLALGIVAVVALALVSRFFPGVAGSTTSFRFLPILGARLNYPVGYWNGLAFLAAVAVPLLLASASTEKLLLLRSGALAPLPAVAAAVYLTSSRGGFMAAGLGALVFVLATPARVRAVAALGTAGMGAAVAIATLHAHLDLVNRPDVTTASERHRAALIIVAVCFGVGAVYAVGDAVLSRLRPPLLLERAVVGALAIAVISAVAATHPLRRIEQFKSLQVSSAANPDYIEQHVLSAGGNGRWQLWTAAVDEFRTAPLAGRGAGSYAGWWEQHRPYPLYVRDAHSAYLQTLGELGLVGALLLIGVVVVPFAAGVARATRSSGDGRVQDAGLLGALAAFMLGLGVDWMWQLPVVGICGIAVAAVLVTHDREAVPLETRRRRRLAMGLGATTAVASIVAQAIPLLAAQRLESSARSAASGDIVGAISAAQDARAIEPWDSAAYVQLALVAEQAGRYNTADGWIHRAIRRERADWRLWLIATRVETEAAKPRLARASLAQARRLNPIGVRQLLR